MNSSTDTNVCQQERLAFPIWMRNEQFIVCVSLSFLSILDGQSIAIDRSTRHTTFLVQGNRILKGKDCIRSCLPAIREDRREK